MSDPYVAEIRVFPFNFAPRGWAACNGQILPISQNTALFSLIGTYYGGNGTSNFGLPNLQGNIPIGQGQGPGLSIYDLGESGGVANVTLLVSQMPAHPHSLMAQRLPPPDSGAPTNAVLGQSGETQMYSNATSPLTPMNNNSLTVAGGSLPHNNLMPYLTLNFCIALVGVFPARP